MNIAVLAKSPEWLNTCYIATRTCKSANTPQELAKMVAGTDTEKKERLLRNIFKAGHLSIFEHASITFAVSGVSRTLLAQLTRHRIGWSYSVQSQRYVRLSNPSIAIPDTIRANDEAVSAYGEALTKSFDTYHKLLEMGVPAEDARFLLPMGVDCNLVTTCNFRAFLDAYHKRVEVKGAQWEIREMFEHMAELIMEAEPWTRALFE